MPNVLRRISETWIVWTIVGVVVVFDAGAVVLGILDRHVQTLSATVMFSPTTIGFAAFGALIVWRHRAHSIGWLDRPRHALHRRDAAPAPAVPRRPAAHPALAARGGGGRPGDGNAATVPFVLSIVLFPVVMGLAILRYRLYDIDVVIRKTLVYACLVAFLGAVYLGGIAILGSLSVSATGQSNEVAATITTLVVAFAFQPLRRRIQRAIDRRFSRRTVDAETAMRAFSGRLREEIDLDALCSELTGVVEHTFQPRHTSLWLRSPAEA